jgi:hypothetical protein
LGTRYKRKETLNIVATVAGAMAGLKTTLALLCIVALLVDVRAGKYS